MKKNTSRRSFLKTSVAAATAMALPSGVLAANGNPGANGRVQMQRDDLAGRATVSIEGQEAFVYRYGPEAGLAHYYPVRSPEGKSMTVQFPDRFPHHRSFWFADQVALEGHSNVHFYNAWHSREETEDGTLLFPHRIRHDQWLDIEEREDALRIQKKLLWEMDYDTPVLDEHRDMRVRALGDGEYFLDITFTVTAAYGDVTFDSDWSHYAWPYIRMNETFNVEEGGGRIVNSEGGVNQEGTDQQEAVWVDYSATADDETAGLAIFSHPDNEQPHQWLTRDYGCFGPRRIDELWGEPFTLSEGESMSRRVGVLAHRGDVESGRVEERYEAYVGGEL